MTTSAVVYTFLFLHVGIILVVTAYYTLGAALAPRMTTRSRVRFAHRPWLMALIGLAISVPWVIAAIVLLNLPAAPVKFLGAAIGCLWVLCGLIGGAGIAQHIGRSRQAGDEGEVTWVQTFRGGLFITLTWILPLVGWLGMLPLTLATGIGCLVSSVFPLRTEREARPAPQPVAPIPPVV